MRETETAAMEDLRGALKNRNLTVSTVADKGRCLSAMRDFYPGDVIISQEPYVCVPNNSSAESRCDGCFTTSKLKKCSGCQAVWYCGSTCQRAEWKLHRLECEVLSRLEKDKRKSVTPSIRLMVKLYLRRKLQSEKVIPSTASDNYNLVEALVARILLAFFAFRSSVLNTVLGIFSHMSMMIVLFNTNFDVDMSDINEERLVLYAQMANLVNLILQWPEINIKEIAENFSKFACNAHTICDSELRPLGTGLYPVISIVNHSCLPNSVLVFEGRSAVVRAVQHIPKDSEVLISYIETARSTMTRQKVLKEQYLFTCTCPRCVRMGQFDDIRESAILEGYRCKNEKCCGFLLRTNGFQCQECGLVRDMEEIKLIETKVKSLSEDKAPKLHTTGNYQEAVAVYKIIEKFQSALCHPFSISLLQTREKLLKLLMELEHWREALQYCKLTLPVYQRVYPAVHPLLGLQYYTCGKLEWYLGDADGAVKSLTKAVDVLRITHGTNAPFMKELLMKLEEARAEASYQQSSRYN
ncbi:histone-lysine N-methyltransferase ASHR1 isoform X2 [Prosopis cineraria]|uniref:histone-lysine N-methyltransferase ASHR1 isoform X2 n=1 Tax=Prosopis cineraria TaxID=364024 RepID=UPI00240F1D14|nr:histone-lysine N-methyltransferase ASHR1 isoform X2 [Prosopis cineraria]